MKKTNYWVTNVALAVVCLTAGIGSWASDGNDQLPIITPFDGNYHGLNFVSGIGPHNGFTQPLDPNNAPAGTPNTIFEFLIKYADPDWGAQGMGFDWYDLPNLVLYLIGPDNTTYKIQYGGGMGTVGELFVPPGNDAPPPGSVLYDPNNPPGGIPIMTYVKPAELAGSESAALGTWAYFWFIEDNDPPDNGYEAGQTAPPLSYFRVVPESNIALTPVDQNGNVPFPGFNGLVANPGQPPDYFDGAGASTFTFRVKYQESTPLGPRGIKPYAWSAVNSDTWADPMPYDVLSGSFKYWNYDKITPAPFNSFYVPQPAPYQWSSNLEVDTDGDEVPDDTPKLPGVKLYIDGAVHMMELDPNLNGGKKYDELTPQDFENGVIFRYVVDPNSFEFNTMFPEPNQMPQSQSRGRAYNNGYAAFTYGNHNFVYAATNAYQAVDAKGRAAGGANANAPADFTRRFVYFGSNAPYNFSILSASDGLFPIGSVPVGSRVAHPVVKPVLTEGYYRPNYYEDAGTQNGFTPGSRGVADTVWRFFVTYYGDNNIGPPTVSVTVNNVSYQMSKVNPLDNDYTDGVQYKYDLNLPVSTKPHVVYWSASDGTRTTKFPTRPDDDPWNVDVQPTIGNDHGDWWNANSDLPAHPNPVDTTRSGRDPRVNNKPILSNPGVEPPSGPAGQKFTFKITYKDADTLGPFPFNNSRQGDPPRYTYCYIISPILSGDSKRHFVRVDMTKLSPPGDVYTGGAVFGYEANNLENLAEFYDNNGSQKAMGQYYAAYLYYDNWGNTTYPETGEMVKFPDTVTLPPDPSLTKGVFPDQSEANFAPGPLIGAHTDPTVSNISVSPTKGVQSTTDPIATPGTTFTYKVTYTQAEDLPPASGYPILVYWRDGDSTQTDIVMTELDSGDLKYTDGKVYYKDLTFPVPDNYKYKIKYTDGISLELQTSVKSGPLVKNRPNMDVDFSNGGVTPSAGNEGTAFEFRVNYTDTQNFAPQSVKLVIKRYNGSTYETFKTLTMTNEDTNDTTFNNGVIYLVNKDELNNPLKFTQNQVGFPYKYYFTAVDNTSQQSYLPFTLNTPPIESEWYSFSVGPNNAPILVAPDDNLELQEIITSSGRTWKYRVKYQDPDGNAPSQVRVFIDGETTGRVMTKEGTGNDYVAGETYSYTTPANSLARGVSHNYYFTASDSLLNARYPASGTQSGPTVNNLAPVLSAQTVTPGTGGSGDTFTFSVTYTDSDNDAPNYVKVTLDGDSNKVYAMSRRSGQSGSYAGGIIYDATLLGSVIGGDPDGQTHGFQMTARDAYSSDPKDATPVNGVGPTVKSALFTAFSVTPGTLQLGATITASGTLNPVPDAENRKVTMSYLGPNGGGATRDVDIDVSGNFTDQFTPNLTGQWTVRATWNGDGDYDQVTAETQVTVTSITSPLFFQNSLYMISVPLLPVDTNVNTLFGSVTEDLNLIRWMTTQQTYAVFNNNPVGYPAAQGGQAHWIRPTADISFAPNGAAADVTQSYTFRLNAGWNMIGTVFNSAANIADIKVSYLGNTVSLAQAASNGWIRANGWRYDPLTRSYVSVSANAAQQADRQLQPFLGYWWRALVDCDFILPAPSLGGQGRNHKMNSESRGSSGEWSISLTAKAGDYSDISNFLGVSRSAEKLSGIESPPYPVGQGYVDLYFTRSDSGRGTDKLAGDYRQEAGGVKEWLFEVATDQANSKVSIAWPDLSAAGSKDDFTLYDLESGKSVFMRTAASYDFISSRDNSPRKFKIVAEPAEKNALVITNLGFNTSRGGTTFSFTLSRDADATVIVYDLRGHVIRTLSKPTAATRGLNQVSWDGRDNQGRLVPRGTYLVAVDARAADGRRAKVAQNMTYIR